jgi:uncharacterized membrane protein YqhA
MVAASIVAIPSIHLLPVFMEIIQIDDKAAMACHHPYGVCFIALVTCPTG